MPKNTEIDSSSLSSFAEIVPKIAALCDEWNDAEKWVKEGEIVNRNAVSPSINELRYAGRRLVDACESARCGDISAADKHLLEAGENLAKARHDVADSIVGYIAGRANDIRGRIGAGALKQHFEGYEKLFGTLKSAARKIAESRKDRARRNEIYGAVMREEFPALRRLHDELEESLPAIEQNVKKETRRHLYFICGTVCSVFGIFGIVFGAVF